MSFIIALWLTGWRVILANLFWPLGFALEIVLIVLANIIYKRAPVIDEPVEEYVEFSEEELQRLYELRRRYVAQEVQP